MSKREADAKARPPLAAPEPLLTVDETAAILRLSTRQIRRLIASRALTVVRIGKSVRVRPEDLRRLLTLADSK